MRTCNLPQAEEPDEILGPATLNKLTFLEKVVATK